MKKRILFITLLLLVTMAFTSVLLAESTPVVHLIEGNNGNGGGSCVGTGQGTAIPDNDPVGVCFQVNVAGPAGSVVNDVTVNVAANHSWIGDLEFWVNSPDGSYLAALDRPGYAGQVYPGCCGDSSDLSASSPIAFYDSSANDAELMGAGGGANVVCQTNGICDYFPNPDGAVGSLANFAGFAGETAVGTWEFCAADNADGDTGDVGAITIDVSCSSPSAPAIVLTKTVGLDSNVCATTDSIEIPAGGGGTDVTYCYYMTNTGNITADLHTVVDDQLGTLLGPGFPATVGPGGSAWFTVTTLITQTTVNSATWSTTDAAGGNPASADDSATVTRGAPTDVSLSSFGSDQAALSPVWLVSLLAIILGFGFVLRRKMANN
jgi:subtilisin-like proprotein convertase family protein